MNEKWHKLSIRDDTSLAELDGGWAEGFEYSSRDYTDIFVGNTGDDLVEVFNGPISFSDDGYGGKQYRGKLQQQYSWTNRMTELYVAIDGVEYVLPAIITKDDPGFTFGEIDPVSDELVFTNYPIIIFGVSPTSNLFVVYSDDASVDSLNSFSIKAHRTELMSGQDDSGEK